MVIQEKGSEVDTRPKEDAKHNCMSIFNAIYDTPLIRILNVNTSSIDGGIYVGQENNIGQHIHISTYEAYMIMQALGPNRYGWIACMWVKDT